MEKEKKYHYSVLLITDGSCIYLLRSNNKKRIKVDANRIMRNILCEGISSITAVERDLRKDVVTRSWQAHVTELGKIVFK